MEKRLDNRFFTIFVNNNLFIKLLKPTYMKNLPLLGLFLFFVISLNAQIDTLSGQTAPEADSLVGASLDLVESMPRFYSAECEALSTLREKNKCAQEAMLKFIYERIKYPPIAHENNFQGTVVIRYVVNEDGSISNAEILRNVPGGCGEEALRVIKEFPNWIPGQQNGEVVKVYFNIPIKFGLEKQKFRLFGKKQKPKN